MFKKRKKAAIHTEGFRPDIAVSTVQGSVPIYAVHEAYNLIETYPGCFTRMYAVGENNYMTATDDERQIYNNGWKAFLNSFGAETEVSLTIYNRSLNEADFEEGVLLKERGDEHDYLIKQMNGIIRDRMMKGRNGMKKDPYLTVGIHTPNLSKAAEVFTWLEERIDDGLKKIHSEARVLAMEERLEILFGIYNAPDEHLIRRTRIMDEEGRTRVENHFDLSAIRAQGLSVRDLIAPSSMKVMPGYIRMGEKYVRTFKVRDFSPRMDDKFLKDMTDTGFTCLTTLRYRKITAKAADALIAKNLSFARDTKRRMIRAGQKAGVYDDSYIDPSVLEQEAEALALREATHDKGEKLFETALTVTVFADSLQRLEEFSASIEDKYKGVGVDLRVLRNQQEEGFDSTLPLCCDRIIEKRTLTSSASAVFVPFSTFELHDPGGINYSCNLLSKNLIVYDRLSSSNFNGFILGESGAGKSFAAKTEMLNVFLKTASDIVVIDPEDEYTALAKLLGGEVIKIMPGGKAHINPMEIMTDYELEDEMNPVYAKADYILKLCECMVKVPFGIDSIQETIIDRCVQELYEPYVEGERLGPIPPEKMPTLTDLQKKLARCDEPEARKLALSLRLYTGSGSLNAFGFQTNVHTINRFTVYQIRDIGDRLKNLSMLAILDHIWNQIVRNRKIGRNTWFYIDEIYLLFMNEYSANFLNTLFRRARKYGGVPTGITQNVSSLLESPTARDMLQNCCFIEMLSQADPDREQLRDLLNLSKTQLSYITSAPKGQGLLYTGKNVVPFYSQFPKDNDVYRCLTSDLKEIKAYEAQEKRKESRKQKEALNIIT